MFTGIISSIGTVVAADGGRFTVRSDYAADSIALGASICHDGVCLTVTSVQPDGAGSRYTLDVSNETLSLTTLGRLAVGAPVNLERAMLPTDRLGGHLVSGHVDGLGIAAKRWDDARAERWRFEAPMALLRYIAHKGSVCVDGVSLTVNAVDDISSESGGFEVALIPHTVAHTAFHALREGDAVNLEVDLLARYVERLLATKDKA